MAMSSHPISSPMIGRTSLFWTAVPATAATPVPLARRWGRLSSEDWRAPRSPLAQAAAARASVRQVWTAGDALAALELPSEMRQARLRRTQQALLQLLRPPRRPSTQPPACDEADLVQVDAIAALRDDGHRDRH